MMRAIGWLWVGSAWMLLIVPAFVFVVLPGIARLHRRRVAAVRRDTIRRGAEVARRAYLERRAFEQARQP